MDGLVLCERHALEAKLEGQIECWNEMLFHIDLWSREARRRERPDVVGLLAGSARAGYIYHRAGLRRTEHAQEDRDTLAWGTRGHEEPREGRR